MLNPFAYYLDLPPFEIDNSLPDPYSEPIQYEYGIGEHRKVLLDDFKKKSVAHYIRYFANTEYVKKFFKLVPELVGSVQQIGFQSVDNYWNDPEGSIFLPHTDGARGKYVISYNIDMGGSEVKTIWYREKWMPSERDGKIYHYTTENLEFLTSVIFKPGWNIIKANVIHSIYPIFSPRRAFTVSFSREDLFEQIINKYAMKSES
jgi:hypothetical protein